MEGWIDIEVTDHNGYIHIVTVDGGLKEVKLVMDVLVQLGYSPDYEVIMSSESDDEN
jgi:hypothetical protein